MMVFVVTPAGIDFRKETISFPGIPAFGMPKTNDESSRRILSVFTSSAFFMCCGFVPVKDVDWRERPATVRISGAGARAVGAGARFSNFSFGTGTPPP